MRLGHHELRNTLFVAPMAGVTDRPFRQLCKRFGAGVAVSEMVSSKPELRGTAKTQRRMDHTGEVDPIVVQIAGGEPGMLADAARYNVDHGAQIIDINMGCPAKKVCNVAAGSALLKDEALVGRILEAVVAAVNVPVTLKFRTGWRPEHKNALAVAKMAEDAGVQMLALHGRTRACGYVGAVEYETIAAVKAAVAIPVIANGDINSPEQAMRVLEQTGADGIMIGRAAQGRPWIFREIEHFLATGRRLAPPLVAEIRAVLIEHLEGLYEFYGHEMGVRVARKHIGWYTRGLADAETFRRYVNTLETCAQQLLAVQHYFADLATSDERLRYVEETVAA
ncbi:MAG: tRNA dihydrouridine synthase DusB [Burkholderiales bacterium]